MDIRTLYPLTVPIAVAGVGCAAGAFAMSNNHQATLHFRADLLTLIILAVTSALIPNAGQQLYDLGLSLTTIEILKEVGYFVFGSTTTRAWRLLQNSSRRWLLMILVPISFAQPIMWTFAYLCWSIRGFAP